ncbi:DUF6544 family protein [Pleomorphovibrio marinus]|uniref:DUF6544 family protein n=1 Tax=Pleomorphovibrio marinus TaxID=2164132 RepID=UPI001300BBB2|nr:DUF6544 family protein [Pleomorphovibrio marinus]
MFGASTSTSNLRAIVFKNIARLSFLSCTGMKKVYFNDRAELLKRNKAFETEIFTEELIEELPEPIKKYLRVCGYMNTTVPVNANVYWSESRLKMSPQKDWDKLHTSQFNSVKPIGRVALMKFESMPVAARDLYRDGYGEMNGKLLNLIRVVFDNSRETAQSALITTFCEFMFIPGYLLLDSVKWEDMRNNAVKGTLNDNGLEVTGVFYFDEDGLFTHFETDDRYYSTGKNQYKKVKFSAFVESYKMQGNLKICEKVKIVWHLPDGDFEYYRGIVDSIEINVNE